MIFNPICALIFLTRNMWIHWFQSNLNIILNCWASLYSFQLPPDNETFPPGDKYSNYWCKTHSFRWPLVPLVQLLLSHLNVHSGKWGAAEKKGRWFRTWNPSYIQGSNYFHAPPLCLRWILRSQKRRISTFHPSCLLYAPSFLCHSRACVINLLSVHANRMLQSFPLLLEAPFRQLSWLLKISISCFHTYRNPAAFSWDPEPEKRSGRKKDGLSGEGRSITVGFHERIRGKGKKEKKGRCGEKELRYEERANSFYLWMHPCAYLSVTWRHRRTSSGWKPPRSSGRSPSSYRAAPSALLWQPPSTYCSSQQHSVPIGQLRQKPG